ncbi:hypothetical protein ACLBX9_16770 [Methylobacterium sp. A49B]
MLRLQFINPPNDVDPAWFATASATNLISIFALLVGVAAGLVAWFAWRTTARHNSNEHVHKLFSEYLRLRLDHDDDVSGSGASDITDLAGFKLYILEEMYNWVFLQEILQSRIGFLQRKHIRNALNDNIEAWKRTIIVHVLQNFDGSRQSIEDFACCYSVAFIKFVAFETNDTDLTRLASIHDLALQNKQRRPLGRGEKKLLNEVASRERAQEASD